MHVKPPAASPPAKDIYLQKVEHLFAEAGAAAARDLAVDMVALAGADTGFSIAKFLNTRGCTSEALAVLEETCRMYKGRLDIREYLGKRVSSTLSKISPPLAPTEAVESDRCEFVTVLGSSHARSFASGTRFLPLMLGPGGALTFLTPETAATTKRVTWSAIDRCDPKSLVLLLFGNADVNHQVIDTHGTRTAVQNGTFESDDAVIRIATSRYFELIDDIRAKTNLNIVILAATPAIAPKGVELVKVFNEELAKYAATSGVPLLDLTPELAEPTTGKLRQDLQSREGDTHMNHKAVPIIEEGLRKLALLPATGMPFEWEYMFRFSINPEVEARIWSEPHMGGKNILNSKKIQFAQILERACHILTSYLSQAHPADILILNGREGFLSFEIPPALANRIVSVDTQPSKALMGDRIRRLLGRTDITFQTTERLSDSLANQYDHIMLVIHENDDAAQCLEAALTAIGKARQHLFILTARDIASHISAMPQHGAPAEIGLSNRLVTGYWAGARLFVMTPAA